MKIKKGFLLIVCKCGKIKAYGNWKWCDKSLSEIIESYYQDELFGDFEITFFAEICDDCKERRIEQ